MTARTRDRKRPRNPVRTERIERQYAGQLKRVAEEVGRIVNSQPVGDPAALPTVTSLLDRYAQALTDWAHKTASRMLSEVQKQDFIAWKAMSAEMSAAMRREISGAPLGDTVRALLADRVALIKSIPTEAAQRVHKLTMEAVVSGNRSASLVTEIRRSGEVAASRARLIARTEVASTASALTRARAQHIGSEGYIWRTAGDGDVRHSHAAMNGRFVRWDSPPTLDGMTGHAGCFPNCRCYPEPVIPED